MRLIDAPVGVFRFDNELVLKTEYSKKYGSVYCPECYILSSGERFWGGMETIEDFETKYNYLEVEPVNIKLGQEPTIQPEPYEDAVSREKINKFCHEVIKRDPDGDNDIVKAFEAFRAYVNSLPPVTPKQAEGEWIDITNDESLDTEFKCSECGWELFLWSNLTNFCPNCGAKMKPYKGKE